MALEKAELNSWLILNYDSDYFPCLFMGNSIIFSGKKGKNIKVIHFFRYFLYVNKYELETVFLLIISLCAWLALASERNGSINASQMKVPWPKIFDQQTNIVIKKFLGK